MAASETSSVASVAGHRSFASLEQGRIGISSLRWPSHVRFPNVARSGATNTVRQAVTIGPGVARTTRERLRSQSRSASRCCSAWRRCGATRARAFANTISGTDLIVGARSGAIQLLLYSVFRIGNATSNISWESYRDIAGFPRVRWTVPISLGDSYRGFRVMGTTRAYFEHYRNARTESLAFATGGAFDDVFDAVLGAAAGVALLYVALLIGQPVVARGFGLHVPIAMPAPADWWIIAAVVRRASRPAAFPRPAPTGCR